MARTKTGTTRKARHQKVLKSNKGMRGANSRLYKHAHEAYLHSGQYAYEGRKHRKRDMRSLWTVRINAAVRSLDATMNYSKFIHALKETKIALDRKVLSHLASTDMPAFTAVFNKALGR